MGLGVLTNGHGLLPFYKIGTLSQLILCAASQSAYRYKLP